ncbi:efflux RND transporter periplasmic adaptor subunit [Lutimaribacter sp. EGI FJ00015]|uniref:Efflux RND transporter periplasmic adaptor subunit n=1 Tax=Lutimaribacter degradans TaxID=2945989 RepID=A0ACC5ZVR3_9RHOB|nr:efflux RND transporter periplasmic adaptor subunit [Lutimaribacter sp. EGI FJ00013]MCM2562285.1 efflux RND transporter periplasmic adaptor subunit [Lutimaribacter sp. EGI FJ00013]MCO0613440.1 efflux RND transporter periplasmic adaptor subunit [Lutimaribacter sp. EGI FJ00015]MCO0636414.1 efflux RND transporter periplasmic adaptor subunit [Lutimaribacter sp. EGI FJ00014]
MSFFKQLLILVVLAAGSYGGYLLYQEHYATEPTAAQGRGPQSAPVEVAPAVLREMPEIVEAVGTTRALQSVEIVPEASGRIEEMPISTGQRVEAGQVLVRLDDAIARADLTEAEAQLTERERTVERAKQLRESNAVAAATLDQAEARLAEARAQLDRARQRLSERTILAPFGGVVGLSEVDVGARVNAGTQITWLDDLSEVEIGFALPETLFSRVRSGQAVNALSAAFPGQEFTGVIDAVDSRIDPVSRSFRARARIPNPDGTLPAGMFMSLQLILGRPEMVTVPEEALVYQAAETYVFVVEDDTARRITVKTGPRLDGMVAIVDGLNEGARVVTRGLHRVRDGGAVSIRAESDTPAAANQSDS